MPNLSRRPLRVNSRSNRIASITGTSSVFSSVSRSGTVVSSQTEHDVETASSATDEEETESHRRKITEIWDETSTMRVHTDPLQCTPSNRSPVFAFLPSSVNRCLETRLAGIRAQLAAVASTPLAYSSSKWRRLRSSWGSSAVAAADAHRNTLSSRRRAVLSPSTHDHTDAVVAGAEARSCCLPLLLCCVPLLLLLLLSAAAVQVLSMYSTHPVDLLFHRSPLYRSGGDDSRQVSLEEALAHLRASMAAMGPPGDSCLALAQAGDGVGDLSGACVAEQLVQVHFLLQEVRLAHSQLEQRLNASGEEVEDRLRRQLTLLLHQHTQAASGETHDLLVTTQLQDELRNLTHSFHALLAALGGGAHSSSSGAAAAFDSFEGVSVPRRTAEALLIVQKSLLHLEVRTTEISALYTALESRLRSVETGTVDELSEVRREVSEVRAKLAELQALCDELRVQVSAAASRASDTSGSEDGQLQLTRLTESIESIRSWAATRDESLHEQVGLQISAVLAEHSRLGKRLEGVEGALEQLSRSLAAREERQRRVEEVVGLELESGLTEQVRQLTQSVEALGEGHLQLRRLEAGIAGLREADAEHEAQLAALGRRVEQLGTDLLQVVSSVDAKHQQLVEANADLAARLLAVQEASDTLAGRSVTLDVVRREVSAVRSWVEERVASRAAVSSAEVGLAGLEEGIAWLKSRVEATEAEVALLRTDNEQLRSALERTAEREKQLSVHMGTLEQSLSDVDVQLASALAQLAAAREEGAAGYRDCMYKIESTITQHDMASSIRLALDNAKSDISAAKLDDARNDSAKVESNSQAAQERRHIAGLESLLVALRQELDTVRESRGLEETPAAPCSCDHLNLSALNDSHVLSHIRASLGTLLPTAADGTGLADFALESSGGAVVSVRCTETYSRHAARVSLFGLPLWYEVPSPRSVIQPGVIAPGHCWPFAGSTGQIVIQLAAPVLVSGFSYEHIPATISPTGDISSAPLDLLLFGLASSEDEPGTPLGTFRYSGNAPLQTFLLDPPHALFPAVLVQVASNHGNPDYTCLYRLRVHGTLPN